MGNAFKADDREQKKEPVQGEWRSVQPVRHMLEHSPNWTFTQMRNNFAPNSETTYTTPPRAQRAVDITQNRDNLSLRNEGEPAERLIPVQLAPRFLSYLKGLKLV